MFSLVAWESSFGQGKSSGYNNNTDKRKLIPNFAVMKVLKTSNTLIISDYKFSYFHFKNTNLTDFQWRVKVISGNYFLLNRNFHRKISFFYFAYYRSENNQSEINMDSIPPELLINRGRICIIV